MDTQVTHVCMYIRNMLFAFYLFPSQVEIKSDSLFQNRIAILKMAHKRMLSKLRKPVDKEEWVKPRSFFTFHEV